MAINITRSTIDEGLEQIIKALEPFALQHPRAEIDLYRHGKYRVRLRIVDLVFSRMTKSDRYLLIKPCLDSIDEEVLSDMIVIVMITPQERSESFSSMESDDPVPAYN